MAAFLKHIGKHGDRKVAIVFRQVPGEEHMCLVIYPEVLPAAWHDAIMRVLESDIGQQDDELANALHRSLLPDGRMILETLHAERMLKKIRTSDVIVTPTTDAKIRLDELNTMLNQMKQGDEAIKKMAENDASRGLVDPAVKRGAEARYKEEQAARAAQVQRQLEQPLVQQDAVGLSDRQLAANMLEQALRMEREAKGLIAEAARMKKEAEKMQPNVVLSDSTLPPPAEPKKRGRPAKVQVANEAE